MFKNFLFLFFLIILNNSLLANPIAIDTKKPIKIEADEVKIQKNKNVIDFMGKVKATQENLNIFSDKMLVKYQKDSKNKISIKNIKAFGNVILKNETLTAKGDNAVYDFSNQIITLKGNIILNEKDVVILGDILTYDIITKETRMESENKTVIKNNNTIEKEKDNKNKKRVIIILDNINDLKDRYDK